jgi:hypothetical protein
MSVCRRSCAIVVGVMLLAPGVRAAQPSATPAPDDVEECNRVAQTKLNPLTPESAASDQAPRRSGWLKKPQAPPPVTAPPPDPADESLRGMHEVGFKNEHYRKAYRECIKERGASESAAR